MSENVVCYYVDGKKSDPVNKDQLIALIKRCVIFRDTLIDIRGQVVKAERIKELKETFKEMDEEVKTSIQDTEQLQEETNISGVHETMDDKACWSLVNSFLGFGQIFQVLGFVIFVSMLIIGFLMLMGDWECIGACVMVSSVPVLALLYTWSMLYRGWACIIQQLKNIEILLEERTTNKEE